MKQVATRSSSGMFTRFTASRVIRVRDMINGNFLRMLDSVRNGAVFEDESVAVVEESMSTLNGRLRQSRTLKAVLLNDNLYASFVAANPSVEPYIVEIIVIDDFLIPEDRFSRSLTRIAPVQSLHTAETFTVPGGGVVNLGVPFEVATLVVDSLTPTSVDANAGTVTFNVGDVGDTALFTFVTQALHPVLKIRRSVTQPTGSDTGPIANETFAYVVNTTLADLLSIPLPTI